MGFAKEIEKVRNAELSPGLRYISLRHAVELHAPTGFEDTWRALCAQCGLAEYGDKFSHEDFLTAAKFLEKLHAQRLKSGG